MLYKIVCQYEVNTDDGNEFGLTKMCDILQSDCRQEISCCSYYPEKLRITVECGNYLSDDENYVMISKNYKE